ncbi:hypothetical protein EJB05_21972, partial [Eragrostis curvula]
MAHLHFYINQTKFCPQNIDQYISNLTSSYTDQSNELAMVSASVIMFVLAGLFFNLNLFSGVSDISAILDPRVRLFLTSALSLFLPVMSYLFSEAKNAARHSATSATMSSNTASGGGAGDLSLMAGLILAWMLLVELLRKKVDEIRMRGYSGTIQRAGRVVWLGNLVFFNIKTAGRKAVFSILWILCATRVVQRIAFTELGKRSYAHGKNARVISSYMAQMLPEQAQHPVMGGDVEQAVHRDGNELLRRCKYIVMGEERLVEEATADGYKLMAITDDSVVSVGKVWELAESDELFTSAEQRKGLKRLCLSFALFKLLRRKFEHAPEATDEEARDCRDLILKGLYCHCNDIGESSEALLQVMNDEVNFLCEYYHSVVPVALASPFFFVVNYFLVLIVVALLCLMAVILCGNGDTSYAFRSISDDNYVLQFGFGKLAVCIFSKAIRSPSAFFSIVDLAITALLFVIFLYEEIWEFFVFLLSNWFMVSLLANYTSKPQWRESPSFRLAFHCLLHMRSTLSHPNLSFRQFSALNLRWPLRLPFVPALSLGLRKELVPKDVKKSIIDYLVQHAHATGTANYTPLTNGRNALRRNGLDNLSWACDSSSVAEVILTWHIATSILEAEHEPQSNTEADLSRVAITLSKYCAYLVAFHPELLPDNPEKAEAVIDSMKAELRGMLGRQDYYLSPLSKRVNKIVAMEAKKDQTTEEATTCGDQTGVVRNGARLGRMLRPEEDDSEGVRRVWKMLADVWTELVVFVAPSSDEERVKAHGDVLVQGGEFITVLWALTTHTGVSRLVNKPTAAWGGHPKTLEDLFGESMRAPCPAAI